MKKIYTILTSVIVLVILVHIIYMVLGFTQTGIFNEDIAMNMGYTLMYLAILHGIYGIVKLVHVIVMKTRLKKRNNGAGAVQVKGLGATVATAAQRISGILIVLLIIPHTLIKLESAGWLLTVIDVIFVLAMIIHMFIGLPKWLVSLGVVGDRTEQRLAGFYGGKKK